MAYDMYVSNEIMQETEERLRKIRDNLLNASEQMSRSLQSSGTFLAGRQFERTKDNTEQCLKRTEIIVENLQNARRYIAELERLLDEYRECSYNGEMS